MPSDLTPDVLAALPGLLDAATSVPWEWVHDPGPGWSGWRLAPGILLADGSDGTPGGDSIDRANAALLALAPTLARGVLAAEAEKERLREALSEALNLRVRSRRLEEMDGAALEQSMRDGRDYTRSMTIPLWVEDQLQRDLEAWEASARAALAAYREAGEGRG